MLIVTQVFSGTFATGETPGPESYRLVWQVPWKELEVNRSKKRLVELSSSLGDGDWWRSAIIWADFENVADLKWQRLSREQWSVGDCWRPTLLPSTGLGGTATETIYEEREPWEAGNGNGSQGLRSSEFFRVAHVTGHSLGYTGKDYKVENKEPPIQDLKDRWCSSCIWEISTSFKL